MTKADQLQMVRDIYHLYDDPARWCADHLWKGKADVMSSLARFYEADQYCIAGAAYYVTRTWPGVPHFLWEHPTIQALADAIGLNPRDMVNDLNNTQGYHAVRRVLLDAMIRLERQVEPVEVLAS